MVKGIVENGGMKKYKNIIYDLDGTLVDTRPGVKEAVRRTVAGLHLVPLEDGVLENFVGPPMQESFQKYYGFNFEEALEAANLFRDNYKNYSLFGGVLYPGIIEMLKLQRENGIRIAVATNKSHENAVDILKHFGIAPFCSFVKGSDRQGSLSKADIINISIKEMGADKEDTVYIGDSSYDAKGAKQVGLDFIAVTYGFGFNGKKDLLGMKYVSICKTVGEINKFIGIVGI